MNNLYKKTTLYVASVVAGFLAFSPLVSCKSLSRKIKEKEIKAPVVTEEVVEAPAEEVAAAEKEVPAIEEAPVEEKKEEITTPPEPKKSLEEKVAKEPVVSPVLEYAPKTSDIILDYIRALEPDIDDLYSTLPSRAQEFGLGLINGLATEIDNLDMDYRLLGKQAGDYLAKTADVAGLITEATDRFNKAPKEEQELILNWLATNINQKLKDYINADPEGAQMFYDGLLNYINNQDKAVQEKFIELYDSVRTLGIDAF